MNTQLPSLVPRLSARTQTREITSGKPGDEANNYPSFSFETPHSDNMSQVVNLRSANTQTHSCIHNINFLSLDVSDPFLWPRPPAPPLEQYPLLPEGEHHTARAIDLQYLHCLVGTGQVNDRLTCQKFCLMEGTKEDRRGRRNVL